MVREDMAVVEVTEEDTEDRTKWRWKPDVATPDGRREGGRRLSNVQWSLVGIPLAYNNIMFIKMSTANASVTHKQGIQNNIN